MIKTDVAMKSTFLFNRGWLFLVVILTLTLGCNPDDVPQPSDAGNIESYLLNEGKALDLLRIDGVFPRTPYQWPGDNRIYYDSVLSVDREFATYVSDSTWNYAYLGWLYEAIGRVSDNFMVRTFRIDGSDTTFTDANRLLIRSAFLLKLGTDRQYYLGWDLWGMGHYFQSIPPITAGLWFADSTSIRGDFDLYHFRLAEPVLASGGYRKLSDFRVMADSTEIRIDVETRNIGSPVKYLTRISYTSESGYVSQRLDVLDVDHSTGTIWLHEPPDIVYDFIVISVYKSTTREFVQAWIVPYRVNPI